MQERNRMHPEEQNVQEQGLRTKEVGKGGKARETKRYL